jgi:small-conductance mechanosensitive channel
VEDFLNQIYFNNTILSYVKAIGIFIIGIILIKIFKSIILSRLKKWASKTQTTIDDFVIIGIQKSIVPILYYGILYVAARSLKLSPDANSALNILSVFVVTFYSIRLITSVMDFSIVSYTSKQDDGVQKAKQLKSISALARLLIWGVGIIFLLDNLGVNISAVVAGLGIGGIAVALAAQAILGDLFSYFIIFFDRPFEIGDLIIIDNKTGTVEHIGIKSTRIRALSGEQLVLSNTDLTSSRIHNYKKLQKRRIVFQLGVIYQTTAEQLRLIPEIVKQIIVDNPDAEFERGHFKSFGDFSLNFEFVYYVLSPEYVTYMDIQQSINLSIYDAFEKEGIEFAYPTQMLYINKEATRMGI